MILVHVPGPALRQRLGQDQLEVALLLLADGGPGLAAEPLPQPRPHLEPQPRLPAHLHPRHRVLLPGQREPGGGLSQET